MPGLGTTNSRLKNGHFTLVFGWTRDTANHFFTGHRTDNTLDSFVHPYRSSNILTMTAIYQINDRSSLTVSLPIAINSLDLDFPLTGPSPYSQRNYERAAGFADSSIIYRSLIFNPQEKRSWNISLGGGLVPPTGNWDAQSIIPNAMGLDPTLKPVHHTIQPAQGGLGVYTEAQAFKVVRFPVRNTTLWAFGSYLIQPMGRTHINSIESDVLPVRPTVDHFLKTLFRIIFWFALLPLFPFQKQRTNVILLDSGFMQV